MRPRGIIPPGVARVKASSALGCVVFVLSLGNARAIAAATGSAFLDALRQWVYREPEALFSGIRTDDRPSHVSVGSDFDRGGGARRRPGEQVRCVPLALQQSLLRGARP